jgi:hypothetical protein
MLEPVASTLTTLCWHTAVLEKYRYAYWLNYVLPCDGFTRFKSLKNLVITYQCLFGATDPQWSHIAPSPPELLLSSLEALDIEYPKVALLDWLARLSYFRNELPTLSDVGLHCVSKLGDAYDEIVYESHPHPALAALRLLNVRFRVGCSQQHWQPEWDDYDLETLDMLPSLDSFGSSCVGKLAPYYYSPA